jgi:hypothetical protein
MADRFSSMAEDLLGPSTMAVAITPSASPLPYVTKRIWSGAGGTITLITTGGTTVSYVSVPAGSYLNIRATTITAAPAGAIAEY